MVGFPDNLSLGTSKGHFIHITKNTFINHSQHLTRIVEDQIYTFYKSQRQVPIFRRCHSISLLSRNEPLPPKSYNHRIFYRTDLGLCNYQFDYLTFITTLASSSPLYLFYNSSSIFLVLCFLLRIVNRNQ